ncbi:MAG: efflux RND transporter permease subunit [Gemmataceae bacterium]|nr:efflux RND transporter permease subunit [Gemmataceae bacterium]
MWLIKASLRNPYMVAAFVFMLIILGSLSILSIPIDILPVFKAPAVQVLTYYPGMPASSIEKTITNRIERWVNQAPGARLVESRSVPGVSVVKVYFRDDIDPNEALTLTNSLALGALPNLPPNTLPPVALPFDATGTLPVGILTVSNPFMDDARQKDVARIQVRNMLGAVPGCISPVVVGGRDRSVMVYLDPAKMEARNMAPLDVVAALRKGNLMVTPGTAYFGSDQLLLDSNAMAEKVEDFNDMPLTFGGVSNVLLRDIGRAEDASAIQTSRVRINDRNEVFVPIYRQRGSSSLKVVDGVRDLIPEMEERLPKGTKLDLVMDQTVVVRSALSSLVEEAVIGALLVSIMILLFLGNWRMTLIASFSIPLALMGAVIGLHITGNTINAMTLAGLALAIGPLVDDAIVELENNHRNYHMGKSRVRAALDGCSEVMVPVLVATFTTVLVLAPLALMPGIGGFLFRPLTMAVGFAMLTSFLLSRTFVPMMCANFLPDEHLHSSVAAVAKKSGRLLQILDRFQSVLDRLTQRYLSLLDWSLEHRATVIFGVVMLFVLSLGLLKGIGREFFPQVDAGQITLHLRSPSNLRLDASENRVKQVEQFLKENIPALEREMIVSEIGLNPDWSAAYTTNSGQQDAVIRVQLNHKRSKSAQEYAAKLRHLFNAKPEFSDLRVDFDTGGMISTALNQGASSPIDIEIEGGTVEQSLSIARKLRESVSSVRGTVDVRVHQRDDAPYLVLDVDRVKAAKLGLSAEDVVLQVVVALNSSVSVSRNFWIDSQTGNQYFVGVQYPEDVDRKLDDVMGLPVKGAGQPTPVNLGTLVTPRRKSGAVEINHAGLRKVTNLLVNTEGRDMGAVAGEITDIVKTVELPEGMRLQLKGEYERMNDSFRQLSLGLVLAAVLVYLLQVTLFRSWSGPLVIMSTVPLGFIGVLWMLYLTGTTLNVQSLMGVIFLVGIAVNNGVLLVDFANRSRLNGTSAREAICAAASTRFRPILMTFLATVLALTPMALGTGRGNEANVPLARAVVGGLFSSTFLTLFLVPILYTIIVRKFNAVDPRLADELGDNITGPIVS